MGRFKELVYKLFYSPEQFARKLGARIGKNCRIYTYYWGSEPFLIDIGDHVHISRDVKFITHDGGVWVFRQQEADFDVFGKIIIKDNTFIGNEAMILPGVTIGQNCIVGGLSLVSKSVPDNCVVAGNPARFICTTEEYYDKIKELNLKTKTLSLRERLHLLRSLPEGKQITKEYLRREKNHPEEP
ncbi:acyltransferase [candidate division KSB1 bacterium]|nr:acyltransferase [candidate division KSB1 bacterium]RQW02909.1 MAG: acyltransferase [candidate division KSB1 bacterium]